MNIKRGELYWLDWSPGRGSEQLGVRPALIIQNDTGNKNSPTTIVAACSTAEADTSYPFIVPFTARESGTKRNGHVDCAHLMTIDKVHLKDKCGELSSSKMLEVDNAIKASLGLRISD